MPLKTTCPKCQASLSISADLVGKTARCRRCQAKFVIDDIRTPVAERSAEQSAETMTQGTTSSLSGTETASVDAWSNRKLGRFEIQGILGQGAFGRVYRAYDPQLDRLLAVKVPTFGPHDGKKAKRFQSEARAAAQLRHPNIVPTFESGTVDGLFFIASQFIDGKPLSEVIKSGAVDVRNAAEWCARIAEALAYAHEIGIVHRDVKPHNVMLDQRGEPQLMDFGLAKRINDDSAMTTEGSLLGTPAYMAPEQARGNLSKIGPHSDQYAVGAILYELLTGQRAFEGSPHAVIAQIVTHEPKAIRDLKPLIPRDLEAITQKAMSKEIAGRYESCHEMAVDLKRWLQGEPTIARPITIAERLTRWAKRNRGLASAIVATAVALVLVAVLGITLAAYQSHAKTVLSEANEKILSEQKKTQSALKQEIVERKRADEQSKAAEERRQLAATRLEESQAGAYVANIRLAAAKWDADDMVGMNAALDAVRPRPGEKDRRGWEWNYLWNRCHSDLATFSIEAPRHNHRVVSYSPDGLTFLCTGAVPVVCNLRSGEVTLRLAEVQQSYSGCFSPDGHWIYIATEAGEISCWNARTGAKRYSVTGKPGVQTGPRLVVSDNGTTIANTGRGLTNYVTIWGTEAGNHIATLKTGEELTDHTVVWDFALSPDGRFAAISVNFAVQIWEAQTGKMIQRIDCDASNTNMSYSPDGRSIALRKADEISIWNLETGKKTVSIPGDNSPRSSLQIRYSPDGGQLAGFFGDSIKVWNTADGKEKVTLKGHINTRDVVFSPDGRWLVSGSPDGTMKIWDANTGITDLDLLPVPDAARLPDGTHTALSSFANPAFSRDGKKLLACGSSAAVWDLESGEPEEHLRLPSSKDRPPVITTSFSADQQLVFGMEWLWWGNEWNAWKDNSVRGWNRFTGEQVLTVNGKEVQGAMAAERLVFSGTSTLDGRRMVTRTHGKSDIQIWDMATGQEVQLLHGHSQLVRCTAYSRDGKKLVSAGDDAQVIVWDVDKGVPLHILEAPEVAKRENALHIFNSVQFNLSGDRVLATTNIPSHHYGIPLRLWDADTGVELPSLRGHIGQIDGAIFSPDGRRIITSAFGETRIWDIDTGQELLTIRRQHRDDQFSVTMACMNQEGTQIVSGQNGLLYTGNVILWDGRPESECKTRSTERAARSTVQYFREKTRTPEELISAIQNDPTINEDVRVMAVKFANRPPTKVVELK